MGRTFQLVRPFLHLTVLENVEAGILFGPTRVRLRSEVKADAIKILERAGLAEKASLKAADLSVVERKWLEIARALAGRPKLLLLDEFMAGLSTSQIPRALELIRSLKASGISVIIVEHIVKAITGACERVIVLNAGKKLAEGSVREIVNDPNVIDAYLGTRHANSN
jgi:branched-chain amino acid transport system ATP-binding protein